MDESLGKGAAELCETSPWAQAFMLDLVRRTLNLGFDSILIDGASAWKLCYGAGHNHVSPDDMMEGVFNWVSEAGRLVRERNPEGYLLGEAPEIFNSQVLDTYLTWWQPGNLNDWKPSSRMEALSDSGTEVLRYLLPRMLMGWGVDNLDRDVMPLAFAKGHVFALMTYNLDGLLGDHPDFAQHVARLATLRKKTMPFLGDAEFLHAKGLTMDGGLGYSYRSDAGAAVGLGNKLNRPTKVKAEFAPEEVGRSPSNGGVLHVEGADPADASPCERDGLLVLETTLPAYGSAVWCLPNA
jgi:hypothetical protein